MSILVLGASGNTGSEVVRQLKATETPFKVLLRDTRKAADLGISDKESIPGDFTDIASLQHAFREQDRLYVAMPPHPDNLLWMENVIAAAQQQHVKHIVKLSGFGAHPEAGSVIIRTHAQTDALLKASGVDYTLLQPNSFFQNLYSSVPTLQDHGTFYLPMRNTAQSVVDIRDVAAVAVAALTQDGHDHKTYRLSGPKALTFAEQAAIISHAWGKPVDYVAVSKDAAEAALKEAGLNDWLAASLAEILDWFAQGGYDTVTDDIQQVLGRSPRTFEAFAQEFVSAITSTP